MLNDLAGKSTSRGTLFEYIFEKCLYFEVKCDFPHNLKWTKS